jgi:hypothetical protein
MVLIVTFYVASFFLKVQGKLSFIGNRGVQKDMPHAL